MVTHHHRDSPGYWSTLLSSHVLLSGFFLWCVCYWPFHVDFLLCPSFVLWGQISETFEQESSGMFLGESAVGADLSGAGGLG